MSLFRKTKIREESEIGKTPVKFRRRKKLLENDPKRLRKRKFKRIAITVTIVLIIGLGGYFGARAYNALKNMFADGSGILSLFNGQGNTQALKGESSGRVNVLLLGVGDEGHSGSTLSDTIIVASYDTKTKSVAMFSLPRDLYVKIPSNGYTKINAAHAYGEQQKEGTGPDAARETVAGTLDIPIHYYARMDFSGLADTVDALGGVEVEVENSFCDYAYPTERKGDTSKICFTAGKQQMNGTKALQYSRSRHALGVEGSDFARSKRQQRLLIAIKEKALSGSTLANPKKLLDVMTALGEHVKTDFQMAEMLRVFELAKEVDTGKIITRNFDNSPEGLLVSSSNTAAGYILKPRTGNFKEIQAVVRGIFAVIAMREEKASISLYNGTWSSGLITTLSKEMKDEGYNIVTSGNADTRNYKKTQIIDYSDGKKPETIKALEAKFGVKAEKETSASPTFEIKVIVGQNYNN